MLIYCLGAQQVSIKINYRVNDSHCAGTGITEDLAKESLDTFLKETLTTAT